MKSVSAILVFSAVLANSVLLAQPAPPAVASTNGLGPRIQFATTVYDWGRSPQGEPVKYTFVFTNTGDALLEITGVTPGCHCTTAGEWSKQVEPGKTGMIPIQFDGQANGPIIRTITVTCNDKEHPAVGLQIRGTIWMRVDVTPQFANLNVVEDSPEGASAVLTIVNNMDPITISAPESNNAHVTGELKAIEPGKKFELTVKATSAPGVDSFLAMLKMKTSSTNVPEINVRALVTSQSPIQVIPDKIMLAPGPLANAQPYPVSIHNSGATLLALSEPSVNANGVAVQLKEVEPGRQFNLVVNFPAGFIVAPGGNVELSIKSSNPKHPVIKVPVIQPGK